MPIRPLTVARPRPPRRLCTPPRGAALIALAIASAPLASADPNEGNGGGINNDTDISLGGNGILFLCPGVRAGTNVFGAGGGYCDMSFQPNWRGGGPAGLAPGETFLAPPGPPPAEEPSPPG